MTSTAYTESMRANSQVLLSEQSRWSRGTSKVTGESFWLIPSSDGKTAHYTSEAGCTCRSYLYRAACSHVLAVREHANRLALSTWITEIAAHSTAASADGWSPIPESEQASHAAYVEQLRSAPEPKARKSYSDLMDTQLVDAF